MGQKEKGKSSTCLMSIFCPHCGNLLLVELDSGGTRFYCNTCPYIFPILQQFSRKLALTRKEKDSVISEDTWTSAMTTEHICPVCGHDKASYAEAQLRSADEP